MKCTHRYALSLVVDISEIMKSVRGSEYAFTACNREHKQFVDVGAVIRNTLFVE